MTGIVLCTNIIYSVLLYILWRHMAWRMVFKILTIINVGTGKHKTCKFTVTRNIEFKWSCVVLILMNSQAKKFEKLLITITKMFETLKTS